MRRSKSAEIAYPAQSSIAEGPVWDARSAVLYWVAIFDHAVHVFDPARGVDRCLPVGQFPGCVAPARGSRLIAALQHGFHWLDPQTGEIEPIVDPEQDLPGNRFNDGGVDPAGRFWAGTIAFDTAPGAASLYRLDPELRFQSMLSGVTISNGIAWSADARTMYYIDTPTHQIHAFDYALESGSLTNRRSVVEIDARLGHPDGMAIDSDGMLWVALWGSSQVVRFDPRSGRQLDCVRLPASNVTSCAFGGPKLDQLFITTARAFISEAELASQPHAGDLFVAEVGVSGLPQAVFAG